MSPSWHLAAVAFASSLTTVTSSASAFAATALESFIISQPSLAAASSLAYRGVVPLVAPPQLQQSFRQRR